MDEGKMEEMEEIQYIIEEIESILERFKDNPRMLSKIVSLTAQLVADMINHGAEGGT